MTATDVTVLVPLHRSGPYIEIVASNLERLAGGCQLVVSDVHDDRVIDDLRERLADSDAIRWLGPREVEPGWVAHYEDLRQHVETPFFLWLPHDDEIDLDYVVRCRAALDDPRVVAATGVIETVRGPGLLDIECPPMPDVGHARRYVARANELLFEWNLGVAFRSVFRTDAVPPLVDTNERSEWADIVWTYGVVLDGELVEVPEARYRKRFYEESTHSRWRPGVHPRALPHLHREVFRRLDLPGRYEIADELVARSAAIGVDEIDRYRLDRDHARDEVERTRTHAADLHENIQGLVDLRHADHAELLRVQAERDQLTERAARLEDELAQVRRTASWRLGQLLLAPVRVLRRLRQARAARR